MHKKRSPCFTSPSVPPIQATGKNEHIWVREKTPRKVFSCQSPEKSSLLWIPPSPPVCENFVIDFTSKSSLALIFMVKISFGPYLTVIKRVACLRWPDLDFVCVFVRLPKEYSVGHNRRSSRLSIVFPWTTPHHPQPPPSLFSQCFVHSCTISCYVVRNAHGEGKMQNMIRTILIRKFFFVFFLAPVQILIQSVDRTPLLSSHS